MQKRLHVNPLLRERRRTFTLLILPGALLYSVFYILPILMGFYFSLMDWNGISKSYNFIGLDNFAATFSDKSFARAMGFTVRYTVLLVVCTVLLSVLLAVLLNQDIRARGFLRTMYFLPAVLSMITVSLVFNQILYRVMPPIGKALGIEALSVNILSRKNTAIYGILFVHLWQGVALPTLMFLAALQTVPSDLLEAATLDGANAWQRFVHVTLVYLLPTLSVVLVLTVKSGLMVFDYVKSMTDGGPGGATQSLALMIYNNGFVRNRYSYSIAQAIEIGLIISAVSFIQIKLTGRKKVD
ncbi:MAG: sugar ABC transporter permease [Clostridiales bacterium]|nr:sugar ABC transporter permease [Clostridiales bacterium]